MRSRLFLELKLNQTHLVTHELIRKMRIHSTNQSFRTIPHPRILRQLSFGNSTPAQRKIGHNGTSLSLQLKKKTPSYLIVSHV